MAARVPLVLLPALLGDADLYRSQIDALGDLADVRVIVASEAGLARSAQAVLVQAPPRFALGGTRWKCWRRPPAASSDCG